MTPLALILAIVQQIVLPEVLKIIKDKQEAGKPVTDADIMAELQARAVAVLSEGQAWLDAHKP